MAARDEEREYLLEDYRQSWAHHRHIEDARSRYLGFFFTASLGSAAIVAPLIAASDLRIGLKVLLIIGFVAVFQLLTFFVFVAIHRFGMVLTHYDASMRANRRRRAALDKIPLESETIVDTQAISAPRLFSVHRTAELIVIAFLIAGMLVAAKLLVVAVEHGLAVPISLACALFAATTATTVVAIVTRSRPRVA